MHFVSLQAPPNLTPLEEGTSAGGSGSVAASWSALLAAGINDWGGVSPLTRDWVNPEEAWPHVSALAEVTAAAGFPLLPRCIMLAALLLHSDHSADRDSLTALQACHHPAH